MEKKDFNRFAYKNKGGVGIRREPTVRINHRIRVPEVRLIDENGSQIGIVPTAQALEIAASKGLDLVEIAPNVKPPVCRVMNYGKYLYEQAKKSKMAKKKQHVIQIKEIRFRPKTEEHDYQVKLKHVRDFLMHGYKVKASVIFRGRELTHKELGYRIVDRLKKDLEEVGEPEMDTKFEGKSLSLMLLGKKKPG